MSTEPLDPDGGEAIEKAEGILPQLLLQGGIMEDTEKDRRRPHAAESSQPSRKGRNRGRMSALEGEYGEYRLKV